MSNTTIKSESKVDEIFETKDYSMFKIPYYTGNINTRHVDKLKNSMIKHGWIETSIITINEIGEIIDGKHRFNAVKEINIPIRYRIRSFSQYVTEFVYGSEKK